MIECYEPGGNGSCIRNRTVQVVSKCELGVLSRQLVRELAHEYPELHIRLATFVRAGRKFSRKGQRHQKVDSPTARPQRQRAASETRSLTPGIEGVEDKILQHLAASERRIGQMLQASEARIAAMLLPTRGSD